MFKVRTWFLLLVVCAGSLEAWFWSSTSNADTATKSPSETTTTAGTTGATTTPGGTKNTEEDDDDDNLSGVGEEIINVASGIRKLVKEWDESPTPSPTPSLTPSSTPSLSPSTSQSTGTTNGSLTPKVEHANPNTTGNTDRVTGVRVEDGSGDHSGSDVELVKVLKGLDGGKVLPSNLTEIIDDVSEINETLEGVLDSTPTPFDSRTNVSDPTCLPVPSDWPICSGKRPKFFTLPNFFNHTSVEEVGAVLQEWAWLTRAGCHHSAEWFLCLLLAPRCSSPAAPAHLPCRSFCLVLQDSCWASLENGRLPVDCHLLPESEQEASYPSCVSVSNWKGNPGGLECILCGDTF